MRTCDGCGGPNTFENPVYDYEDGSQAHDQCAEEMGLPEEEML